MHKIEPSDVPPAGAPVQSTTRASGPPWRRAALIVLLAHVGAYGIAQHVGPAELQMEASTLQFDLVAPVPEPMAPPLVEDPPPPAPPPPPPPPEPEPEPEPIVAAPAPEPVPEPPAPPPPPKRKKQPPKKEQEPPKVEEPPAIEAPPAATVEAPPAPVPVAPVAAAPAPVPVTPARFDAAYLKNPAPPYPRQSRLLGEEGTVRIRVCVDTGGKPTDDVVLERTSGFERLDAIALQTVRRWSFTPARRGNDPVAACVVVPMEFRLDR